jgi:predicted O-methyltransferase YrrM
MRQCATTMEAEMTEEEHALLLGLLRTECFRGTHLEVGTAAGGTLCAMMSCFDGDLPPFVVVDRMRYFPDQEGVVRRNLESHRLDPDQVDFRTVPSNRALAQSLKAGETFDFMLIDACHRATAVTADLRWTRLLNVGGIVCLHDYTRRIASVQLSVDRFLERFPNFSVIGHAGSLIAIRKLAESSRPEISPGDRAYSLVLHARLSMQKRVARWTRAKSA